MTEYRRRLPHLHPDDACLFITWRLWGSLPSPARGEYRSAGHAFVAQDRALELSDDGPFWLRLPRIADLTAAAIVAGERSRGYYDLHAWVVMPNHVHLLILPHVPVPVLMRWLKGSTARSANRILNRTGQPFWQDESYDRYLRNGNQVARVAAYIENNPVSAGLARDAGGWRWSSASWQAECPPHKVGSG